MVKFAHLLYDATANAPGPKRSLDSDADPVAVGVKPTYVVDDASVASWSTTGTGGTGGKTTVTSGASYSYSS